ncbi:MAG: magnesium transporter CorA [Sphingobacteriaceae bacterium]|nr:magnesium transporter CorA [Sphingobacteriaceae bacterium]
MLREIPGPGKFKWIDITNPEKGEIQKVAQEYGLHEALLNDCLQPDHLPKYETMEDYVFMIFRIHSDDETLEADSVQELTHKIAIFYSSEFIITIHRKPQRIINELEALVKEGHFKSCNYLLNVLIRLCLLTYDVPSNNAAKDLEYFEEQVFIRARKVPLLRALYFLKRKIDVTRRMLILSFEIIDNLDTKEGDVNTRDTRDLYIRLQNVYDSLSENTNQLLNLYFSFSSQRTNETMRVLTVFSAFFLPLTFVVGIYGMNFEYMPELSMRLGYPGVLLVMAVITLVIFLWFKRKGWL